MTKRIECRDFRVDRSADGKWCVRLVLYVDGRRMQITELRYSLATAFEAAAIVIRKRLESPYADVIGSADVQAFEACRDIVPSEPQGQDPGVPRSYNLEGRVHDLERLLPELRRQSDIDARLIGVERILLDTGLKHVKGFIEQRLKRIEDQLAELRRQAELQRGKFVSLGEELEAEGIDPIGDPSKPAGPKGCP